MSYSSPQVLQLESIRDWMSTLDVWSEWVDSVDVPTLKARVVWPLSATQTLPVCVLALGAQNVENRSGAAGGANFQPFGTINLFIYAEDTNPTNSQTGWSDFADLFFRLVTEMADKAHQAPVLFNAFRTPEVPIVHSSWVNTEDDGQGLGNYWIGQVTISWGDSGG